MLTVIFSIIYSIIIFLSFIFHSTGTASQSGHSRKSSLTSQISTNSGREDDDDDDDGDDNDDDDDDDNDDDGDDNVCSSWHPMRKQEELWKHFATLFILINSLGSAPTPHFLSFSTSSYENPHAWEICFLGGINFDWFNQSI